MPKFQVVEKESFGTDWALVRYDSQSLQRFDDSESAIKAAVNYITDRNCNNSLTKDEKLKNCEVFMMTTKGAFLGLLDGEEWYMTDRKGNPVDAKSFELEGKTQVTVRAVPGT